jgi:hypothetical protein
VLDEIQKVLIKFKLNSKTFCHLKYHSYSWNLEKQGEFFLQVPAKPFELNVFKFIGRSLSLEQKDIEEAQLIVALSLSLSLSLSLFFWTLPNVVFKRGLIANLHATRF